MLDKSKIQQDLDLDRFIKFQRTGLCELSGSIKKYEAEAINKNGVECLIDIRFAFSKQFLKQILVDHIPFSNSNSGIKEKIIVYYFNPQQVKEEFSILEVPSEYLIQYNKVTRYYIPDSKLDTEKLEREYLELNNCRSLKEPLLSLVIPTFNSSRYIEQVLQSIHSQVDYKNIEIVIIDSLSDDKTLDIAKRYLKQNDIIISEKDDGIFDAINKGTHLSSGEYSLFLGSDDLLMPCALLNFKKSFNKNRGLDFYYGDFYTLHGTELRLKNTFIKMPRYGEFNLGHPSMFIRKQAFIDVKGFNTNYSTCSDADFELKLIKSGKTHSKIDGMISIFRAGGFSSINLKKLKEAKRLFKANDAINYKFYAWGAKYALYFFIKKAKILYRRL